jgi:putative flippase GtrA
MVQIAGTGPVSGSMAGFGAGVLVNYCLNYHLTFKSNKPHRTALPKFLVIAMAGLCLNTLIMALATEWLHYLLSQALATAPVLAWNFLCNRLWTFREDFLLKCRKGEKRGSPISSVAGQEQSTIPFKPTNWNQ